MSDGPARITQPTLDVLGVLLDAKDHELHGWAIMKSVHRGGPTVYKILERLTEAGWVDARWEIQEPTDNRPRRRLYRLTSQGVVKAQQLVETRARPHAAPRWRPALGQGGAL
ncbi:PadR family transcriptional regulator [Micromonospora vinacea]|uniref:PadR family transcriptional regulator n=1 Tax=Micromonospora vinacea TaxID=709878 RepID=UPI003D9478E7